MSHVIQLLGGMRLGGSCRVCGKKTCVACSRTCDKYLMMVCQGCVKTIEVWINGSLYHRKICDFCISVYPQSL